MTRKKVVFMVLPLSVLFVLALLLILYQWHLSRIKDSVLSVAGQDVVTVDCKQTAQYYQNAGVDVPANAHLIYSCDGTAKYMHDTIVEYSARSDFALAPSDTIGLFRVQQGPYEIEYNLIDSHSDVVRTDSEHIDQMSVTVYYSR